MQDQDEFAFVGYVENLWQALLRQMNKAAGNAGDEEGHEYSRSDRSEPYGPNAKHARFSTHAKA